MHLLTSLVAAAAIAAAGSAAPGDFTPVAARSVFAEGGYSVSPITTWDWLSPSVSTFTVEDTQRGRILMVEVCADVAAAQVAERRLPTGFTSATWLYNVALFEATQQEYDALTDTAQAVSTGMVPETDDDLAVTAQSASNTLVEHQYSDLLVFGSAAASQP